MKKTFVIFVFLLAFLPTALLGFNHGAAPNYFENDGASLPWYSSGVTPPGIYVPTTNTTWLTWEGWQAVNGTMQRVTELVTKNWTTGQWSKNYICGTNTLTNDKHGIPAIVRDLQGYVYTFYGSHSTAEKIARTSNPDDPSSCTSLPDLAGPHTFPNPTLGTDDKIYYFDSTQAGSFGNQSAIEVIQGTTSNGTISWGAATQLVDGSGGGTGWIPLTSVYTVGTKTHFVFPFGSTIGADLSGIYYAIYDRVNGNVTNYSGSFVATPGQQPVVLSDLNTSFRIATGTQLGFPTLSVDASGNSYVVFGSAPTIQFMTAANGGAFSSPQTIFNFPPDNQYCNTEAIVQNANGTLDVYFPDGAAHRNVDGEIDCPGNIQRVTRSTSGVWSSPTVIKAMIAGQPLLSPFAIVGAPASSQVMFTEVSGDQISISGVLKGYLYGREDFIYR